MKNHHPMPSLERIRESLDYNQEQGVFRWKIQIGKGRVGRLAGTTVCSRGYRRIGIDGTHYQLHRLAWFHVHGVDPGYAAMDHINGNPRDNRIENLRLASPAENQRNTKLMKNNTSGTKGVSWGKKSRRWETRITICGKRLFLGTFDNYNDAVIVVKQARERIHGEFARQS